MEKGKEDGSPMQIRSYRPEDLTAILTLFYQSVHQIGCAHYNAKQLSAWAPRHPDTVRWREGLATHDSIVAIIAGKLAGFADMDAKGYLDRLYVGPGFIRRGVGSALVHTLEAHAGLRGVSCFYTEASITARPFFQAQGYRVTTPQIKTLRGQQFVQYRMVKRIEEKG